MRFIDDGGSAFPQPGWIDSDGSHHFPADGYGMGGMTLRDYFAAAALAHPSTHDQPAYDTPTDHAAAWAYSVADAMLAERSKP